MKKQIVVGTLVLFILATGISIYLSTRKAKPLSVLELLPASKQHKHIAPDGTIVEHRHTYKAPEPSADTPQPKRVSEAKHPIQRAWEALDLAAIKRKYQPYTIAEMREMWDGKYLQHCGPFGNFPPGESPVEKADNVYPRDEWLERALNLGRPFVTFSDYRNALGSRIGFNRQREWWAGPEFVYSRDVKINTLHLLPDTTWEEYIDMSLKFGIVHRVNFLRAKEADPSIQGGTTSLEGVFLPFKDNTVHVHISPKTGFSSFIGAKLTQAEKDDLTNYGIAPKGVTVIYVDENEKPLPPGTPPPTFHEKRMKALGEAQTILQQQIQEHEALLDIDALLNPPEKGKQIAPAPHDHATEHEHDHTHETLQPPDTLTPQQRQHLDAKQPPPLQQLPPELRTLDAVNQWFTSLEALHDGQLPKDLQALRKVITELEKIRQEGEAKLKPPPRPERPAPSPPNAPSEGGSPD